MSERIFVAVHGMGDQTEYETVQQVVAQISYFYDHRGNPPEIGYFSRVPPSTIPLGRFSSVQGRSRRPGDEPSPGLDAAYVPSGNPDPVILDGQTQMGVAEVYWADVPRLPADEQHTLEDAKHWGVTLVEKLRYRAEQQRQNAAAQVAMAQAAVQAAALQPAAMQQAAQSHLAAAQAAQAVASRLPTPSDLDRTAAVIEEIVEGVHQVDRVLAVARLVKGFQFDLKRIFDQFLGDVQFVTEFEQYRTMILARFDDVLGRINAHHPNADVYIIAHSEGTAVAFLALVRAMADPNTAPPWIRQIHGFLTIGSPIDKHIILWPEILPQQSNGLPNRPLAPVVWCNYYDYGDPVGFRLDTARAWLQQVGACDPVPGAAPDVAPQAFGFRQDDDCGFGRYPLPGLAHIDYWNDPEVFRHFLQTAVHGQPKSPKPQDRDWARGSSRIAPYLLVFFLMAAGVYGLFKGVSNAPGNESAPARLERGVAVAVAPDTAGRSDKGNQKDSQAARSAKQLNLSAKETIGVVLVYTLLIFGMTVAARVPRLTNSRELWLEAYVVLVVSLAVYCAALTRLKWLQGTPDDPNVWLLVGAPIVAIVSACWSRLAPRSGMFPLLAAGLALLVGFLAGILLQHGSPTTNWWPALLGGGVFLYAWWIAAILFDLAFVWHHYIRSEQGIIVLRRFQLSGDNGAELE